MVYGMFLLYSLSILIIVEGTMDQLNYASVLAHHVHPYMRIAFRPIYGINQYNNARYHSPHRVRAWFEKH